MRIFNKKNTEKQANAKAQMGEAEIADLNKAMMDRCIPVAKEILKIIVDASLTIGDTVIPRNEQGQALPLEADNRPQEYKDAALKIQQLMLDHDLLWMERHMVFMLVKQPVEMLQNIVLTDLETSYQHGICRMFGIEVFGELSFKQIDKFLKADRPTA
jgi:hypothetical protein